MSKKRISIAILVTFLSAAGAAALIADEGVKLMPYKDTAGVWTDGVGNTKNVVPGKLITEEKAMADLHRNATEHGRGLEKCFGDCPPMAQHEYDAILNLAFNVGVGSVCRSSIARKVKAGNISEACRVIPTFRLTTYKGKKISCADPVHLKNKATGCAGLMARRQRQYKTCMGEL